MPDASMFWLIGAIAATLFFLIKGISATVDLKEKLTKDKEPKSDPPLHQRFAPKERLDQVEKDIAGVKDDVSAVKHDVSGVKDDVSKLRKEIGEGFGKLSLQRSESADRIFTAIREYDKRNEDRVTGVHNRVNDILLAVGELNGKVGKS